MISMIEPSVLPRIVFVTAHDKHALKAFEEHAADYLLKPIEPLRLQKTLDWLRSGKSQSAILPAATTLPLVPCTAKNRIQLIPTTEIEYVFSDISGVHVVCANRDGLTDLTLKLLQERTPLLRCHRQYLVNAEKIDEIELQDNGGAEILTQSGQRIPVSRRHLRELKDRLLIA
jgi:two-component system LytT family response regulator